MITQSIKYDQKEKILFVALELFAIDGFAATSTKSIAKKAGVSEGLIFSHYESKTGLLEAINKLAEENLHLVLKPVMECNLPKKAINMLIDLLFEIDESEYNFWRLQFKLKWDTNYYNPNRMKPLVNKMTWCLTQLEYENPQIEAKFLVDIFDTVATNILRDGRESQLPYRQFLKSKYNLTDE